VSAAGLSIADNAVAAAIASEMIRQRESIELIASENFVSQAVLNAQGSVLCGNRHRAHREQRGSVLVINARSEILAKSGFGVSLASHRFEFTRIQMPGS